MSLRRAATDGDVAAVVGLLYAGAPSTRDACPDGVTALMRACEKGDTWIVQELLADGNPPPPSVMSLALARAVACGHHAIVEILLNPSPGLDINYQDEQGNTAPMTAIELRRLAIVDQLLAAGADAQLQNERGETALMKAVHCRRIDVVEKFLAHGVDIDRTTRTGASVVLVATQIHNTSAVAMLLVAGASIRIKAKVSNEQLSPLTMAATHCNAEIVRLMVTKGVMDSNSIKHAQALSDALVVAVRLDCLSITQLLVDALVAIGASVDAVYHPYQVPTLHVAARLGRTAMVVVLLRAGAHVNKTGRDVTALCAAAEAGQDETVKVLLASGDSIDHANHRLSASYHGSVAVVEALLAAGATIHHRTNRGSSALFLAAQEGHARVVDRLIAAGADVDALGEFDATPLMVTSARGHVDVVAVLLAAGASVLYCDGRGGDTALLNACRYGHVEIVRRLLLWCVDVNYMDAEDNSALMLAFYGNRGDIVDALVAAGANPFTIDNSGRKALALSYGQSDPNPIMEKLCALQS